MVKRKEKFEGKVIFFITIKGGIAQTSGHTKNVSLGTFSWELFGAAPPTN